LERAKIMYSIVYIGILKRGEVTIGSFRGALQRGSDS